MSTNAPAACSKAEFVDELNHDRKAPLLGIGVIV